MKNWQRYPEYKDSGVEWLGEIPKHWTIMPIKFALAIPITDGPHETPNFYDQGIPFISAEAIKNDRIDFEKKRGYISLDDHKKFSKKYKPIYGDVYMVKSGATTGNVARVETNEEFNIWSPLAVLRPKSKVTTTNFLFYALKSKPLFYSVELSWSFGTQQNIGMGVISNIRMVFPPLPEQKSIAHFLDRETSKLDKLIAKKERFIELLQEKRTALISHAVTKGLNPDVPMKDSGISWLGQIPNHWEVKPLRAILEQRYEYNRGIKTENLLSVIKDVGVINYEDREASGNKKSENIEQYKIIYPGDIVVNRMNLIFGSVGISKSYGASSTEYYVLKPKSENTDNLYYSYIFCNKSFQQSLIGIGKGILFHRMRIYSEEFKKIIFPIPPLSEQKAIADFLDQETAKIDTLIEKTKTSIEKLKEYRTALISAAVTGKIDIREEI